MEANWSQRSVEAEEPEGPLRPAGRGSGLPLDRFRYGNPLELPEGMIRASSKYFILPDRERNRVTEHGRAALSRCGAVAAIYTFRVGSAGFPMGEYKELPKSYFYPINVMSEEGSASSAREAPPPPRVSLRPDGGPKRPERYIRTARGRTESPLYPELVNSLTNHLDRVSLGPSR